MIEKISLPVMTEPGHETEIDFSGKIHMEHITDKPYILIRIDRYIKWPVVRIRKSTKVKKVIEFLERCNNFSGVPEKMKSDRGNAFIKKDYREFSKNKNIETEYSPPMLHTGTKAVDCAKKTLKNFIIANLEDKIGFTESKNQALRGMQFKIHTALKVSPFELHYGRKLRTELTNIVKDIKSYLSDWKTMNISVLPKQIPIYVARNEKRDVTDHILMARKWKIHSCSSHESLKRKPIKPVCGNFQYP